MNVTTLVNEESALAPEIASLLHDLRNPLSVIHSCAEMLIDPEMATPQVRRLTKNLYAASIGVKELIDTLLSRYRTARSAAEACDLREVIEFAIGRVAFAAECQSIQIIQAVPENLVVTLDRKRIQQVFVNLLVNALEAMPDGGNIRITAAPQSHSVLVKVRDSGPGIAPEIRGRLFREFATSGKVNGLGLGLAFSRKAVIDHGGDIWAESSRDGTCMTVRLTRIAQTARCIPCGPW
jgi:signal transduction histidine kinase